MTAHAARHMPASGVGSLMAYWRFYRAVAATQLSTWLADSAPAGGLIVDVSGPHLPCATQAAAAGQTVIRAVPAELAIALSPLEPAASSARSSARPLRAAADSLRAAVDCSPLRAAADSLRAAADSRPRWAATDRRPRRAATDGNSSRSHLERTRPGPIATVQADLAALPFMDDRSVDGVIADDRTLSRHLFTEQLRLPGSRHGDPCRAASLGRTHRLAKRGGGARAVAGRDHHPMLWG